MVKYIYMKQRSTTPVSTSFATRAALVAASILMMIAAPIAIAPQVKADKYDEQIAALQKQIDAYNSQAGKLSKERQTYENQLAKLNNEKAQIQAQIDISQAKADKLQQQIEENQRKIEENKEALGIIIADMYVDDNITPLELLASSKNIGDYVDKQAYRESIQDTLTQTIDRINALKKKLEAQKKAVERELAQQTLARNALQEKENEKANLIAKVRGRESVFQNLSAKAEREKLEVQRAQQAAIEAAMNAGGGGTFLPGDPNKGGYPWQAGCYVDANALSSGADPLGYGCRQCVSYTAWKVGQRTGNFPRYWGNANMWPGSARASGYSTGSTPRAHSVGVISAGQYGHVVWVERVNGDGTVNISQYNYYNAGGPGWGNYSEMRVSASTYDTYIYF